MGSIHISCHQHLFYNTISGHTHIGSSSSGDNGINILHRVRRTAAAINSISSSRSNRQDIVDRPVTTATMATTYSGCRTLIQPQATNIPYTISSPTCPRARNLPTRPVPIPHPPWPYWCGTIDFIWIVSGRVWLFGVPITNHRSKIGRHTFIVVFTYKYLLINWTVDMYIRWKIPLVTSSIKN